MKRYYNIQTGDYYCEGSSITKMVGGALFSGVPSEEQLLTWGFEEMGEQVSTEPTEADTIRARMDEILSELQATDYLALKAFEGEDMSEHVGWKENRASLRAEYRECESRLEELNQETTEEEE